MSILATPVRQFATIGVIGGFGPQAGAIFAKRVFDECALEGAKATPDFPRLILINVQTEPVFGGNDAGFANREKTLADIRVAVEELERAGADVIAIPCNSLFAAYRELEALCSVPLIHIVDPIVARAVEQGLKRLLLLGTDTTLRPENDVYYSRCARAGIELITPNQKEERMITRCIQDVLTNAPLDSAQRFLKQLIMEYGQKQNIDGVIVGCTELSAVVPLRHKKVALLDSLDLYARGITVYSRIARVRLWYDEGKLYGELNLLVRFVESHKPPSIQEYFVADDRWVKSLKSSWVLDVGCGWGRHLELMAGDVRIGVGIDNDASAIMRARKRGQHPHLSFYEGSAYALPFPDRMFDTVVCMNNTFGNLYKHRRALKEMIRVARPGGKIVVSVHGKEMMRDKIEWYATVGLTNPVFREDISAVVTEEGFYSYCYEKEDVKELLRGFPVDFTIEKLTPASLLCEVTKQSTIKI